jgi:biotin carboxyl carrier protein
MGDKAKNAEFSELALESGNYETRLNKKFAQRKLYEKPDSRLVKAVIPGVIAEIEASAGKSVKRGDVLLVLEAMKMRNLIKAPHDGRIAAVHVASGDKVVKGQVLIEFE